MMTTMMTATTAETEEKMKKKTATSMNQMIGKRKTMTSLTEGLDAPGPMGGPEEAQTEAQTARATKTMKKRPQIGHTRVTLMTLKWSGEACPTR